MGEPPIRLFKTTTLADQVYEYLLRQISTGAYRPSSPLRELDLVAQFGVSRTPIREALLRLAESGLVEMNGRSARVRRLEEHDVVHIYQVRRALEVEAARLAWGRYTDADFAELEELVPKDHEESGVSGFEAACYELDGKLHRLVAERSGNPLLAQELRKLHDLVQLVHRPMADRGQMVLELHQHVQILAALKAGDRKAYGRALHQHLRSACQAQVSCVRALANGLAPDAANGEHSAAASWGS